MSWIAYWCSFLCGQVHCLTIGGIPLPLCQRCTGMYVGAAIAFAAWKFVRPREGVGLLAIHVGLLLAMIPFGFHRVPQGDGLRLATGIAYGVGLVGCLSMASESRGMHRSKASWKYWAAVLIAYAALVGLIGWGSVFSAIGVLGLAACGCVVLLMLVAVNLKSVGQFSVEVIHWRTHSEN